MAATFEWCEDNGTAAGSPPKGATRTIGRTEQNWKNVDDTTTAYSVAPISPGSNSFEKWMFGRYTGTFSSISNGLWAHTSGTPGSGLTIKGKVAPGSNTYTTPATAANANLTVNMTSAIAIASGQAVQFGATGPEASGKGSSSSSNPAFTEWMTTQLQTSGSATPGTMATCTFTIQWDES